MGSVVIGYKWCIKSISKMKIKFGQLQTHFAWSHHVWQTICNSRLIDIKIMMDYTSALQKFTYLRSTFGCARRVLEAIQIKTKGPNLNRDKGLNLDPVWDTLLQKRGGQNNALKFSWLHTSSSDVIINYKITAKHQLTTDVAHLKVLLRYVNFCSAEV